MLNILDSLSGEFLSLANIKLLLITGGSVFQILVFVGFILFLLLFERIWFRFFEYPKKLQRCLALDNLQEFAKAKMQMQLAIQNSMGLIRTTISVCPLLGLVGTVVGMIEIFDLIALTGVSNAKLMASGIAKAILPTMAGMVLAITAMFVLAYLQRWSAKQTRLLTKLCVAEQGEK